MRSVTPSCPVGALGALGAGLLFVASAAAAQDVAVHLGSFKTETEGRAAWTRVKGQHGGVLASREARFVETEVSGRGVWVRVLVPAADRNDANRLCQALKASNQYCVPMTGALGVARPIAAPRAPAQPATPPAKAAAPPAVPAPAPQRPATQAPEPIVAPVLPPVEPPAAHAAQTFFGSWARRAQDCFSRDVTFGPSRVVYRDGGMSDAMACKIDATKSQMMLVCEDNSHAVFDVGGPGEIVLRWTKGAPDETPIASGAVWRRCAEAAR